MSNVHTWADFQGNWHARVNDALPHEARELATDAILAEIRERDDAHMPAHVVPIAHEGGTTYGEEAGPLETVRNCCDLFWYEVWKGFAVACLWTGQYSTGQEDEEPEQLDEHVDDLTELPDYIVSQMACELAQFVADVVENAPKSLVTYLGTNERVEWNRSELFGHDFALTREGQGAGFWDRGLGEAGDTLTTLAKQYGGEGLHGGMDSEGQFVLDFN